MRKFTLFASLVLGSSALLAADISGTWSANVVLDVGSGAATFVFKQSGEALSGTYTGMFGEAKVTGTVKDNQLEWRFEIGEVGKVSYNGTLDGARIKGTVEYGALGKGTFSAEKK